MTVILAIDPGVHGALALWDSETRKLACADMPTLSIKRGKSAPLQVDHIELARTIKLLSGDAKRASLAILEQAIVLPTDGRANVARAWHNFGLVKGILAAYCIPAEYPAPRVWKAAMRCPREKDGARYRASQLLPEHAEKWPLKKHDGRAEAALMALYGERFLPQRAGKLEASA